MPECLAKQEENSDSKHLAGEYDLGVPAARRRRAVGSWLIGLSLGAVLTCLCLRSWLVGAATVSMALGLFLLLRFVDDYEPREDSSGRE